MKESKNLIIGVIIAVIVLALVGGAIYFFADKTGEKNTTAEISSNSQKIVENALEEYLKTQYGKAVEEVMFENVKIYTKQEIDSNELFKDYNIGPNDLVFEAKYRLKIIEGYEDMIQFTAATGEVDGQWVNNKYNCGIARYNSENDYSITDLGTAF